MPKYFDKRDNRGDACRCEAAGLAWLGEAEAIALPRPILVERNLLRLPHLVSAPPSKESARTLGKSLALLHASGAPHWGCPPTNWFGSGVMGQTHLPLFTSPTFGCWGEFYAQARVLPYVNQAQENGSLTAAEVEEIKEFCHSLSRGEFEHAQPALVTGSVARIHGDLWGGNVMYCHPEYLDKENMFMPRDPTSEIAQPVLIDPAAQGGHAEEDLAQLALFGTFAWEEVVEAYEATSPLAAGWRRRIPLHQLHMLIVHAALFGGSYGRQTVMALRQASRGW